MKQRMRVDERRRVVLKIMREMHANVNNQEDFTALKVAKKAGISVVWLYRLVGKEFSELRSLLEGPRHPTGTVISKLKNQITSLRKEVRELKAKLKAAASEQLTEAIRMIELLDAENRMLRAEVKMLRQRLAESEVIPFSSYPNAQ
jgi:AraC-like DNA-binding protein